MNIEEATKKLKECPFCGMKHLTIFLLDEEGYQRPYYDELTEYACIECDNCQTTMREQVIDLEVELETLVRKWNTRVKE